jgi:hypothetical protein
MPLRLLMFRLYDLHILGPSGFTRTDISAGLAVLEFENNLSLIFSIRIHPVSEDGSSIKRRFLPLFMEINFAPDQFLCLILIQSPRTAFPYIILDLHKMIQRFNQVYIHFFPSFVELPMAIYGSAFLAVQKQKALSHHNRQGPEIFSLPYMGRTIIQFS